MKVLKVFVDKEEIPDVLQHANLIETYDAFIVVQMGDKSVPVLARKFPTEDITAQYCLQLGTKTVDTLAQPRSLAAKTRGGTAVRVGKPSPGPHHYVVQFIAPIKPHWLSQVRATGAVLRASYGGFAYVVRATEAQLPKIIALKCVRWVGHLPHAERVAPGLTGEARAPTPLPRRRAWPGAFTVEVFDGADIGRIAHAARKLGFKVLSRDARARLLVLHCEYSIAGKQRAVKRLSAVHGVRFIRERVLARTANNVATTVMGNKYAALAASGPKLSGNGEIVAVCDTGLDTGDPCTIHPDFAARIAAIKSYPITLDWSPIIFNPGANDGPADLDSGHGTHVSGSVLGNGAASAAAIRGHAHRARLVFQAIEQEMKWRPNAPAELRRERFILAGIPLNLGSLFQFAYNQGARVHSNSWGGGDPGKYDDQCRQFDDFVWKHKDFCFVIAAGNDGTDRDGDGRINPMSVSSPGTAKNCITVGACENLRPEFDGEKYGDWWPDDYPVAPYKSDPMADDVGKVVAFSSRGPTQDGRSKPDIVAPGTFILSTRSTMLAPNNFAWAAYPPSRKYFYMGGTSMATPLTAGAVALVREFLRTKRRIANPSAALLKALLIAGAKRLRGTSTRVLLDNDQGFGRVNLDRSLRRPLVTLDGPGLATGQKFTKTVSVTTSSRTLRVVFAYSDFPGDKLVNNLNLVVTNPSGRRYVGNQFSAGKMLVMDAANNVEVVQVSKANRGKWTIDVIASSVPSGLQDFALAAVLV